MAWRVLIKGGSGAGKTTLGRRVAGQLGVAFVELDALHHGPGWRAATADELRAAVARTLDDDAGWVVDGNYDSKLGTMLVDRATLIVWLDFPLHTKLWRLIRRTTRRLYRSEELWNGNRETLSGVLLGRDALFAWMVKSHFRQRAAWPAPWVGRPVVRLRSPAEVAAWVARLPDASGP